MWRRVGDDMRRQRAEATCGGEVVGEERYFVRGAMVLLYPVQGKNK